MAIKFSYDTLSVVETTKGGLLAIYQGQEYVRAYTAINKDIIDCRCKHQQEKHCNARIAISRSEPHTLIRDTKKQHTHIGKSEGELYAEAAYRRMLQMGLDTDLKPSSIYTDVLSGLPNPHRHFLKRKRDCIGAINRIRRKNRSREPTNPSGLVVENDVDYSIQRGDEAFHTEVKTSDDMKINHIQRGDEAFHSEVKTSDECIMKIDAAKEEHIQEEVLGPPIRPTRIEFLGALKALDVVRQYASITNGPDMGRLQTMALEMQATGFRHIATQNTNGLI